MASLSPTQVGVGALVALAASALGAACAAPDGGAAEGAPVVLTFSVDLDGVAALERVAPALPATYFVTGKLAEKHPDVVRRLAARGTVGTLGYSHARLGELPLDLLRADLMLGKRLVEDAIGRPVTWFRAPFHVIDGRILTVLDELGFRYDCTTGDTGWRPKGELVALPLSAADGAAHIPSDYQLLVVDKLGEDEALARWLELYQARAAAGRPLVLALQPSVLDAHPALLGRLTHEIGARGGRFVSADGLLDELRRRPRERLGTWVALQLGAHDAAVVAEEIARAGVSDVFVSANDPEGRSYLGGNGDDVFGRFVAALHAVGARVHAWVPIAHDKAAAAAHPDWAMVSGSGERSAEWISFFHPEARQHILAQVEEVVRRYPVDGVHLDYVRFPGVDFDFSPAARRAFEAASGQAMKGVVPGQGWVDADERTRWLGWRTREVTRLVAEIDALVAAVRGDGCELSAALIAESALSSDAREHFAQDYGALARVLDLSIPMAYFQEDRRELGWLEQVALGTRLAVGRGAVMIGLEGFQDPRVGPYPVERFAAALAAAAPATDGVAVYPYLYFFGHGDAQRNMPPEATAVLARALGDGADPLPLWLMGGGAWLCLVALAIRRRRRRAASAVADAVEADARPAPGFRELQPRIDGGPVAGALVEEVALFLQAFGPLAVERFRQAFVLETVAADPALQLRLDDDGRVPGWAVLVLHYAREAREMGLIEGPADEDAAPARLTEVGRERLARAISEGYQRDLWRFIEQRLHEAFDVACPRCRAVNEAFWFWPTLECRGCRREIRLRDVPQVTRGKTAEHPHHYVLA